MATDEEVKQTVQQATQEAAQTMSEAIIKLLQTQGQNLGATVSSGRIENADIGGSERIEEESIDRSGLIFSNEKRTYDEYQHAGLESIKSNQRVIETSMKQLQDELASINNLTIQHLQNAITVANSVNTNAAENANILGKKVAENVGKSGDIATDRLWNVDEQGYTVAAIISALKPTLESVVAKILADMTTNKNG